MRIFAPVGAPGFPASSLVSPRGDVFVGTFASETCCTGPSKVFRWDSTGTLTGTWVVQGQDPQAMNGVQVATDDRTGRLYVLDKVGGRAVTLDPATGEQRPYATFADVPACGDGVPQPCSPTLGDDPPYPNYAAWGPDGSLYVTDYAQALVWKVPPHGGAAKVWLSDARFDGLNFGPTAIVLSPDRKSFLLGVFAGRPGPDSAGTGAIYSVPLRADGSAGQPTTKWESAPGDGVDGFALAASGRMYVALLSPTANAVVELAPDGTELARVPATPVENAQRDVPFDSPSSVSFLGERLIVTNHAVLSGDTSHMVLFDVFAGEPGAPRFVPASAGPLAAAAPGSAGASPAAAGPTTAAPSAVAREPAASAPATTDDAPSASAAGRLPSTGPTPLVVPAVLLVALAGLAWRRQPTG